MPVVQRPVVCSVVKGAEKMGQAGGRYMTGMPDMPDMVTRHKVVECVCVLALFGVFLINRQSSDV